MVDFEGGKRSGFELDNGVDDTVEGASNQFQDNGASYSPGTIIRSADANGVVVLPAGVSPEDITVQGRDLVINLADGSTIVIPDGAIIVPQIVIEDVAIDPATLAALLNAEAIDPEAGPQQAPSSGGNFAADEGAIQDAFDLGNLLPYTELSFPQPEEREVLPEEPDEDPDIVIETPDNPVGVENAIATVLEEGLPERGDGEVTEPEGTNAPGDGETTSGTIVFAAPDGLSAILINGVEITEVGQTFTSPVGTLTITSIDLASGEIGFSYTLQDNTLGEDADGFFEATVIDTDGDQASASLSIIVVDDSPIAADDIGIVPAATFGPIEGNVLDNDVSGADDYPVEGGVTGFANDSGSASPGESLQGEYGVLTLNADGSYSYTRDFNTPGGVTDTFTYDIVDQDGSTSTATLVIEIEDAPDTIDFIPDSGEGTVVDEDALPPRGDEPVGTGEGADGIPDNNSDPEETTGATITFTSPDGVESVTINGVVVSNGGLPISIETDEGTFVVTDYTYDPETGLGTITYEFTLGDNTNGDDTSVDFDVVVTDLDGDVAEDTLTIDIVDDEPEVAPDADTVTEDTATSATGNVITDTEANGDNGSDTVGADDATVTGVAAGDTGDDVTGSVGVDVTGTYGTVTIAADGSYTYTLDNDNPAIQGLDGTETVIDVFTYTITDGDGDTRTTTLTITVNGTDDPVVITGLDGEGAEETVDEDDLSDGSSPDAAALTQDGSFTITSVDGLETLTVGGVTVFGAGVTYPVTVTGQYGEARITGVTTTTDAEGDVVSATVTYEYELSDNTLDHTADGEDSLTDSFEVIATDTDGSTDIASLDVEVIDDVATANADSDSVTEDGPLVADGNVLTANGGTDANATDGVADVSGADGATVTGVAFGASTDDVVGDVGTGVAGNYGSLTIDANGDYAYTLDNANPLVQGLDQTETLTEVFTYTITDGDGDTSTTTVTITINGVDDPVVINGLDLQGPEVVLDEDDLADGSDTAPEPLTQTGTFTVDSQDGLTTLTVGGATVFDAANPVTFPVTIADPTYGILTITGVATTTDANGDVVAATVSYSYTLEGNSLRHDTAGEDSFTDSFEVVATDTDGSTDTASLDIQIVDDIPTALDDGAIQATENTAFTIDALANDIFGADGVDTGDATKVFVSTDATQGTVTYDPATGQFTYTPAPGAGSGGNVADFFEYTIVDADGDESTARVDITLQPDSEPTGGERSATVDDDGLTGGNPLSTDGDLDANTGDLLTDGNEATFAGVLAFDVGNDTPASITFDPALNGATATLGQETVTYSISGNTLTATGPRGVVFTVEITDAATGEYLVTLVDNVLQDAGNAENDAFVSIDFVVEDSDGDTTLTNLGISFDDDAPTATDNSNSVGEGETTGGNVVTDDDGAGTDVAGADDFAAAGPVVDAGFSSSNPAGVTLLNKAVAADGTVTLTTSVGTLVVAADGTYTFTSDANTINVDTALTFTYTVEDGDGDQTTAELVIDIANVAGNVSDNNALVNEAGLDTIGSDGTANSEFFTTGQITVTNATGPFTYELTGSDVGNYGTLTLDTNTGAYSYELTAPVDGDLTGDGGDNDTNPVTGEESFGYIVKDGAGNIIGTGSIDVTIVDDVPTARNDDAQSVVEGAAAIDGNVINPDAADDADASGADTLGADGATMTSVNIGGIDYAIAAAGTTNVNTANGDYTFDPAGNWTFAPTANLDQSAGDVDASFTYTLTDGDGDTDTAIQPISIQDGADPQAGPPITLALDDENLADGSNPAAPDFDTDTIVFTEGSDDIVSIAFDDSLTALDNLGGGLTWVRVSDTQITGSDGARLVVTLDLSVDLGTNTATVTATLNDNYDDHPTIDVDDLADLGSVLVVATDTDGDTASSAVTVTVSDDLPTVAASAPAADALTVDETDLTTDATADFSGLFTPDYNADNPGTIGDYALGISADRADSGLVDTETGETVVLVMNGDVVEGRTETGNALVFTVTVDALGTVELDQIRAVEHPLNPDQNEPVTLGSIDLITLSATVTDSDGDTDTATANIAGAMTFLDDGPALSNVALIGSVQVDETDGFPTSDTSATSIISFTADYGEDQEKSTEVSLSIIDAASDLQTAVGDQDITLVQIDATTIEGQYAGGTVAFTVTINNDINSADFGKVTLTQNVALEHTVDGPEGPAHNDALDLAGKINATITITDGDDDSVSQTVEVGSALSFLDDGPTVTLSGVNDGLTVSDTDLGSDSESFADNFTFDGGEDGAASTAYALSVVDGSFSGLYDNATNEQVLLRDNGGVIEGYTAGTNQLVFTVSVDAGTGEVTLDLVRAIDHALSNGDGDTTSTLVSDDLIKLTAIILDNDGDFDSQELNIGQNLTFTDDVPTAEPTLTATLDDDTQSGGNPGGPDDQTPDTSNLTGTLVDPTEGFGNDGGTVAFDLGSTLPSGYRLVADPASDGVIIEQEQGAGNWVAVVTVTLDATTGAYSVSQTGNILHEDDPANEENEVTFTLGATLTDGDTDTATTSLTITVDDDTPIADPDTFNQLNENDPVSGDVSINDNVGADSPGTYALVGGSLTGAGGLMFNANGTFTYTPAPAEEGSLTFDYTLTDADGDTVTQTVTINLQPDSDPSVGNTNTAVDDDGFPDGNSNNPPADDINADNGDSGAGLGTELVFVGNFNGDFGNDTPGSYTFEDANTFLGTEAITVTWNDATDTLTATSARGDIFTIVVDQATGEYTLTLLQNVLHSGGDNGEVREFLNLAFNAVDSEGEVSPTATFVIAFGDDAPSASTNTIVQIDDDTVGGNPGGVGDDPDAVAIAGTLDHVFGADGGTIAFDLASTLPAGFRLVADPASDGVIIEQEQGTGNWVAVVTVSLDETTGDYTVTQTDNVLHAGGGDENNTILTLDYVVTDGDLDTATSSLTINIDDDTPAPSAVVTPASTVAVDETDLAEAAGSIDLGTFSQAIDTDVGTNPTVVSSTTAGNVLTYTGNFGADGAAAGGGLSYTLAVDNPNTGLVTTDGTLVQLISVSDTVVVGVISGVNTAAFAFEIDPVTGVVTVEQYTSLFHLDPADPNDPVQLAAGSLTAVVTATDADGDSVDSTAVDITSLITFADDAPSAFAPVDRTDISSATLTTDDDGVPNTGTAVASGLINDPDVDGTGTDFIGADGFGDIYFTGDATDDGSILQSGGVNVTSGGAPVYLFGFGTGTLVGTTDINNADASQQVFTLTLDEGTGAGADASYTIDFDRPLDDGSGTVLSNFGAINPNNYDWVGFTSDGDLFDGVDNDGEDILLTAYNTTTGVAGTVNMSASDIGSNNQWMDANETLRIDFVIDGTGAGNEKTPLAYSFDEHNDVTNASFSIIEVKSNGTDAAVTVRLFNDDDTGNIKTLDGASVAITAGSVVVTDSGGNDITGTGAVVT